MESIQRPHLLVGTRSFQYVRKILWSNMRGDGDENSDRRQSTPTRMGGPTQGAGLEISLGAGNGDQIQGTSDGGGFPGLDTGGSEKSRKV